MRSIREELGTMTVIASAKTVTDRGWPVTREASDLLVERIADLRAAVTSLAGQGLEEGIVELELVQAARRLDTLEAVRTRATLVDDGSCAIGRRAVLKDEHGETITYEIVFPGDGEPTRGWISADSPLGAAIIGARPGDVVDVDAPVGRWSATVISVE
jgi:transcription elongation GreA/GreB family factor